MPEILSVLSLSTSHLTEAVAKRLDEDTADPNDWRTMILATAWFDYGWWVYVPEDEATWTEMPHCLGAAFRYAHQLGVQFIKFDQDAPTVESLLSYDW